MAKLRVREVALNILLKIETDGAYSNLLLNETIKKGQLNEKDIRLLTEIVYGTIQHKSLLFYYVNHFVKGNPKKLEHWVKVLLSLSFYQLIFLDRIPERAVIYEAVEIAKKKGHSGIAKLVNGILRSALRNGFPSLDKITDESQRLSLKTSHPEWLTERWIKQYGFITAKAICETNLISPVVTVRINKLKCDNTNSIITQLEKEGVQATHGTIAPEALKINKGNIFKTTLYEAGYLTIQDESSMLVARALDVRTGQKVLDSCAAPGGKTTHIAELMNNVGEIYALDLHEHKIKLIQSQATRLGITIIKAKAYDSKKCGELFLAESFDRILVDAPCTGLGVIRRKPEIKWHKKQQDIETASLTQTEILRAVAPLLRKGGKLVYSTCTIDAVENEAVVNKFLSEHKDFTLDTSLKERLPIQLADYATTGMVQLLPSDFGTDGFFFTALIKK